MKGLNKMEILDRLKNIHGELTEIKKVLTNEDAVNFEILDEIEKIYFVLDDIEEIFEI